MENIDDAEDAMGVGTQAAFYAIVPKVGAALSLLGSSCIILEVTSERMKRRKRSKAASRVLLSMSISDLFFSSGWFLSTWPSPRETSTHMWMPLGNTMTCSFQGFIIQLGWVATPLFNLTLTFFYMLLIKYNHSEKQLSRLEPWIYSFIWIFAAGSATLGVTLNLFNSFGSTMCWFDSLPQGCALDDGVDCIRGQTSRIWALVFQCIPLWPSIIGSCIFMYMIYRTVKETERKSNRYSGARFDSLRASQTKRSKAVATQALWYIGAFFVTFLPDQIATILYFADKGNFWVDMLATLFLPAQGFFNFLIFLRSRVEMTSCLGRAMRRILCPCNTDKNRRSLGGSGKKDRRERRPVVLSCCNHEGRRDTAEMGDWPTRHANVILELKQRIAAGSDSSGAASAAATPHPVEVSNGAPTQGKRESVIRPSSIARAQTFPRNNSVYRLQEENSLPDDETRASAANEKNGPGSNIPGPVTHKMATVDASTLPLEEEMPTEGNAASCASSSLEAVVVSAPSG